MRRETEGVSVQPEFASVVVILANPNLEGSYELSERLLELRDMGYNMHHRFGKDPGGRYSKDLRGFLSGLEDGGYTGWKGDFVNASSLSEQGIRFFERSVLKRYVERPEITQRFADDAGLDLKPIFQKHIGRYLELIDPENS